MIPESYKEIDSEAKCGDCKYCRVLDDGGMYVLVCRHPVTDDYKEVYEIAIDPNLGSCDFFEGRT